LSCRSKGFLAALRARTQHAYGAWVVEEFILEEVSLGRAADRLGYSAAGKSRRYVTSISLMPAGRSFMLLVRKW